MRRLKGFTLTELMVAMAVIGILVAVVTPAVMKTRPNKNKMMVKKTFYTAEQVIDTMINDERLYPDMTDVCYGRVVADNANRIHCAWGFDNWDSANLEGRQHFGSDKFATIFVTYLNLKRDNRANYIYYTTDGVSWNMSGTVASWEQNNDGTKIVGTFDNQNNAVGIGSILVDVNGDEGPNCREAACTDSNDFDQYQIQILANGKMRINPVDAKAADYVTINTSVRGN